MSLTFSKELVDEFFKTRSEESKLHQRLGQAFHNYFKLHKCQQDKVWCDMLYEASTREAEVMIWQRTV